MTFFLIYVTWFDTHSVYCKLSVWQCNTSETALHHDFYLWRM